MTPQQRRFKQVIQRLGDPFERSGVEYRGLVATLSAEQQAAYLTAAEIAAATPPIRLVYVAFDNPTAMGDSVDWDGVTYAVLRSLNLRYGGELVLRMLIIA